MIVHTKREILRDRKGDRHRLSQRERQRERESKIVIVHTKREILRDRKGDRQTERETEK